MPGSEDPAHPLNYPLRTRDDWVDAGCVAIIRHTTDIGAAGGADAHHLLQPADASANHRRRIA
ncbi:MAG: hypothetical protein ACRYGA_12915 [Janthinobacterium lividum]